MIRLGLWILALAIPTLGNAAPIIVRSGEHGSFSRLVLNVAPDTVWQALDGEDHYVLELPDHEGGFDVSRVYQRINSERISSIDVSFSKLTLNLNCICGVSVSRIGSTFLVLDVKDVKESRENDAMETHDRRIDHSDFKVDPQPPDMEILVSDWPEESQNLTDNIPNLSLEEKNIPLLPKPRPLPDFGHIGDNLPNVEDITNDADAILTLEDARTQLLEEFSQASTRGVLKADSSLPLFPLGSNEANIDLNIFDSSQTVQIEGQSENSARNLRVTSSSDILNLGEETNSVTTFGIRCIEPSLLEVALWGKDQIFQDSIGAARSDLYGEFDALNERAILQLARIYIHFGFGAEAIQTLRLDHRTISQNPELYEMAEILEFGSSKSVAVLAQQAECDSAAAFWAILSAADISSFKTINTDAALRELNKLPLHLRRILAPKLSQKLLEYGDREAAKMAMRTLERLPEALDSHASLSQANLDLFEGNIEDAEITLKEIVDSNSIQSAKALISLIDTEMLSGNEVEPSIAKLAEAYSLELRDSELGPEISRVHVLALAKSGQYDSAFEEFGRLQNFNTNGTRKVIFSHLFRLLVDGGEDSVFLRHFFSQPDNDINNLEKEIKVDIIGRVLELGFGFEALGFLDLDEDLSASEVGKILRAKINIFLDKPDAVMEALSGVEGEEAERMRAAANGQAGRKNEAYLSFKRLKDPINAEINARLSEDWTNVVSEDDPIFGSLLGAANRLMVESDGIDGLLGRTESALIESEETRNLLLDLLENPSY